MKTKVILLTLALGATTCLLTHKMAIRRATDSVSRHRAKAVPAAVVAAAGRRQSLLD